LFRALSDGAAAPGGLHTAGSRTRGLCGRIHIARRCSMTIARKLLISGRVQGVFYRGWMVAEAQGLGVAGWVRNRAEGDVEALVIGAPDAVAALIERCRSGPPAAKVTGIAVEETEIVEAEGFRQRPTR